MFPLILGGFLQNTFIFLILVVISFGVFGLFSKSFLVGVMSVFLAFISITIESEYEMFVTMAYVMIPLILIIMSFQIYNLTQTRQPGGV